MTGNVHRELNRTSKHETQEGHEREEYQQELESLGIVLVGFISHSYPI